MEAMRERIIGAVSPYVEIESPELVEVRRPRGARLLAGWRPPGCWGGGGVRT